MNRRTLTPTGATALSGFVFFLSGASALLFETLWFRLAGIALGNSVWAGAIVLASFMGGLALGNALSARYAQRIPRPIVAYARLEILIAVTGLGLVLLLPVLSGWLVPLFRPLLGQPWLINPVRLLVAFALMLIPTTAMGWTLPLLVRVLYATDSRFGKVLGTLYGLNTLGAVAGALAGETVLIGWLGIRGTGCVAAGCNLIAAGVCMALASRFAEGKPPAAGPPRGRLSPRATRLLAGSFLAGGILLSLEIVWFRFLQLFVIGTSFTFAVMLATVLAGIGAGGLVGSWSLKSRSAHRWLTALCLAGGVISVLAYRSFEAPASTLSGTIAQAWEIARLSLALMFPLSLLSGVLFTWIGESVQEEVGVETRTAGWVTLANTVGAMVGALIGAFVLLPRLGVEKSFLLLALAYGAVALCTLERGQWRRGGPAAYATAALATLFLLSPAVFPFGAMDAHLDEVSLKYRERWRSETVATREGLTETVQYLRKDFGGVPLNYRLVTNAHSMSGTALDSKRYMKMFVYWPVAVHPDVRSALLIGFGVGSTARALADTRQLETIDVVDISSDILELSRVVYPEPESNPLHDPRVRSHVGDGRYFLQTTDRRFDLITAEPPPLVVAGAVNLYSREYFRTIRDRLADGGYVTYWLPVNQVPVAATRSIIRGFCDVFEDCSLWAGCGYDWMLVGSRGGRGPVSREQFVRQWNDPVVAPEMAALGLERAGQLGATFIADTARLDEIAGGAQPLVDDRPKRLSLGGATGSDREQYLRWMNVPEIASHFERSSLIRERLPIEVREESRGYFRYQPIANMLVFPDDPLALRIIDTILEQTPLRTAALWLMGSSVDHERIALRAVSEGREGEFDHYLGARALADRDYRTAAGFFGRYPQQRPKLTEPLHIYSLCKLGEASAARELAERFAATHGEAPAYTCWEIDEPADSR